MLLKRIKVLLKRLRARFPSKLPTGVTEFHAWADSFSEIYELPTKHEDSIKFTLATSVMHLGPLDNYKPKHHFYRILTAGAAKQIAGSVFTEIKEKQKQAQNGSV